MGVSGQRHAPVTLYPRGKDPGTHCTGGWVGLRAGLDTEVRVKVFLPLPGIEPRSPGNLTKRGHKTIPGPTKCGLCM